jgi:hypothetical protein
MTARFLLGVAATSLACAATPAQLEAQDRMVIRRNLIEAAGWAKLNEVLLRAGGWQRSSVDGLFMDASPDGIPALSDHAGAWRVLVDGREVPATLFGTRLLELLPISIAQVESVTVTRGGRVMAGAMEHRATIHFHSRTPPSGVSLRATFQVENETGDPGPYLYTPHSTGNIDNNGPYYNALLGLRRGEWYADIGFRRATENITDERISSRVGRGTDNDPDYWHRFNAPTLRAGGRLLGARHDFVAGLARITAFAWVPAQLREESMLARQLHLGWVGEAPLGRRRLSWRAAHTSLEVEEFPFTTRPFSVEHGRDRSDGSLEVELPGGQWNSTVGVGALRTAMVVRAASASEVETRAFASITRSAPGLQPRLDVEARFSRWGSGVGATAELGTDGLRESGGALRLHAMARRAGADGEWMDLSLRGSGDLSGELLASGWIEVSGHAPVGPLRGDLAGRLTSSEVLGYESALRVAELRAAVSTRHAARVQGRLQGRYLHPFGGSGDATYLRRSVSRFSLEGDAVANVARSFTLALLVNLAGPADFLLPRVPVAGEPTSVIGYRVPAVTRVDLSGEHRFWRDRLRANILIRNVFNGAERYHPLGAQFGMGVRATLGVTLP